MSYEIKELQGSLFKNDNKERDNQPDYTGNVKINGKLWRLAAWDTESRGGTMYLSIRVSDPEEFKRRQEQGPPKPPTRRYSDEEFQQRRQLPPRRDPNADFSDDDIPF